MTQKSPSNSVPLPLDVARQTVQGTALRLSALDRSRLDLLLTITTADGLFKLSDALALLFPQHDKERALTDFRQFRRRIKQAACQGTDLTVETDGQKRTPPELRWCWFCAPEIELPRDGDAHEVEPRHSDLASMLRLIIDTQHRQMRMLLNIERRLNELELSLGLSSGGEEQNTTHRS